MEGGVAGARSGGTAGPGEGGFTLLEVLVAFAIAAPALALLFSQGMQSVAASRTAARYEEAVSRAQSHLDALSAPAGAVGEREGDEGRGFHWRTRVTAAASVPARRQVSPGSAYAGGVALYDVTVQVSWPGASGPRAVTLVTRRLGPAAARAP